MSDDKKTPEAIPGYEPTQVFRSVLQVVQEQERVAAEAKTIYDRAENENRALSEAELSEAKRLSEYHARLETKEKPSAIEFEEMIKVSAASMPSQLMVSNQSASVPAAIPEREYNTLPNVVTKDLKCFRPELFGGDRRSAHKAAEEAGHFFRAVLMGDGESVRFCNGRDHLRALIPGGHYMSQHTGAHGADGGALDKGGYLVPEAVAATVLDVRDRVGLIAKICRKYPMMEETDHVPKRIGGLTVFKPTELAQITESDKTFGRVSLVARDAWTLTYISARLMRGSVVDAADQVVNEIGYAFASQQDYEGINGDGTAGTPNWDITGVVPGIAAAGQVTATGATSFDTITAAHINSLIALLPDRFQTRSAGTGSSLAAGRPCFVCSTAFWAETFANVHAAGGGNTKTDLGGDMPYSYHGFPIYTTEQMPAAYAATTDVLLFGNFYESCLLGEKQNVSIAQSEHFRFDYGQLAIRGQIAYDFKFHEPGNGGPGGVVSLVTPA